ncbi:hypothetical protein OC845_005427 [Tilletia horrida]|nr:hypothetical protein OC845_005427 [Tilletia horrida]
MTSSLGALGVRSSEDLVKALKAPSDPPPGLSVPKIEIAKIVAGNQDGLLVPDRFLLICTWILDSFTQASKPQPAKEAASGKAIVAKAKLTAEHWLLLDSLLSDRSKLGAEDIKKLAGAHSVVTILTWFAQQIEPSVQVIMACATFVRSLFLHSATKRASNNIDQLNKCLEASFHALPQWTAIDPRASFEIMAEVSTCWNLACVHAANQKKTFKFFTGEMFDKWTMALSKVKDVSDEADLFALVASFGTTALLTEDILRSYCTIAASIYNTVEHQDESAQGDEITNRLCKSLRSSESDIVASGLAAIPHLLDHLVSKLDTSWTFMAPASITTSLTGPLEQQVYATCIKSAVRRTFLSPICDTMRKTISGPEADARSKVAAAQSRRKILQVMHDSKMLSSATVDDQDWRTWLQILFDDVIADAAVSTSQGLSSLQLLWRLDPTAMEPNVVKMLSLVAGDQNRDTSRESLDSAQLLVQHVTDHYTRTRELPHLCSVLCEAVTTAAESTQTAEVAVKKRKCPPLFSEDGASAWGRPLRNLLVPNQAGQIIDDISSRCSAACQAIERVLTPNSAVSIDEPLPKKRKTQKGRESTANNAPSVDAPELRQSRSMFSICALILRYLRVDDTSAESSARVLRSMVENGLESVMRLLLDRITTSPGSDVPSLGSTVSALLNLQVSIALYYEHLSLTESQVASLPSISLHAWIKDAAKYPPSLRIELLHGLFTELEASSSRSSGSANSTKLVEDIKSLILLDVRSDLQSFEEEGIVQDAFLVLVGRWAHLLASTFEFRSLVDLVDHIFDMNLEPDKIDLLANSRFVEQPKLLAAIYSGAIKRLNRMADKKSPSIRSPVPTLRALESVAIPEPVRASLVASLVKADLNMSKLVSKRPQIQEVVDLRKYLEVLLAIDRSASSAQSCIDWLGEVSFVGFGTWGTAAQSATTDAILAASGTLLGQGSASQASTEAVMSSYTRLQATKDPAARRVAHGLRFLLSDGKVASGIFDIDGPQNTKVVATLEGATFDTDTCLTILDQLQALRHTTSSEQDAQSVTTFSEAVIRFLALADEDQTSNAALAVALEVLRLGWSNTKSDRLARWTATLLSIPILRSHSAALREEVAMRVKDSLGASDYETSLLDLEHYLDTLFLNPANVDERASAVLYTLTLFLCNGPQGTGKVARSSFSRIFQRLHSIPHSLLQGLDPTMLLAVSDLLESLCRQKAVLLRSSDTCEVIDLCAKLVAPSASEYHSRTHDESGKIFGALVGAMTALVRQRPDIMANVMPSLTAVLCQLVALLRHASPDLGSKLMSAAHAGSAPAWLDFSKRTLGSAEADLYSRLLLSLTARTSGLPAIARQKRGINGELLESSTTSLARPFSKYAIHVLVAYCRMLNSSVLTTDPDVRKALQPGLFALCDVVKVHERDAAMITSLGPAEQVVFKDLWARWERQRYRGG